jgi:hypothetical protein
VAIFIAISPLLQASPPPAKVMAKEFKEMALFFSLHFSLFSVCFRSQTKS